jgi:hypothetical protein
MIQKVGLNIKTVSGCIYIDLQQCCIEFFSRWKMVCLATIFVLSLAPKTLACEAHMSVVFNFPFKITGNIDPWI